MDCKRNLYIMSILAGRKILNEILNSDYRDLQERIDNDNAAVSNLGMCGESPAHIAIYKSDSKMLRMLLDAGTEPNLRNSSGETLVHVAAKLGNYECIQMLYETKKCELLLENYNKETALDVANSMVERSCLHSLKLFAEYNSYEPNEKTQIKSIINGRKLCSIYLAEKMIFDREEKVRNMVQNTLNANNERRQKARIIRGISGNNYTSFYSDISYHTDINKPVWEKIDMDFFKQYYTGIDHIVRTIFACDYVNKSIQVGYYNVLIAQGCKIPVNTYPVPIPETKLISMSNPTISIDHLGRSGRTLLDISAPSGSASPMVGRSTSNKHISRPSSSSGNIATGTTTTPTGLIGRGSSKYSATGSISRPTSSNIGNRGEENKNDRVGFILPRDNSRKVLVLPSITSTNNGSGNNGSSGRTSRPSSGNIYTDMELAAQSEVNNSNTTAATASTIGRSTRRTFISPYKQQANNTGTTSTTTSIPVVLVSESRPTTQPSIVPMRAREGIVHSSSGGSSSRLHHIPPASR